MSAVLESPPRAVTVADIEEIERRMKLMPQVEIPVGHDFADGMYLRTITIPAGTRLTGRVHLHENLNILSRGEMSVMTDKGFQRVKAPFWVISPPGTKRIAIAHTECVWTTFLKTELRDPEQIEHEMTCESEQQYLAWREQQNLIQGT